MFKKVFQSISKALGPTAKAEEKPETAKPAAPKKAAEKEAAPAASKAQTTKAPAGKEAAPKPAPAAKPAPQKSPEELCGMDAKMSKDEIRAKLATLYKRYNRAASSLDVKLRSESETMLDAIVTLREKHFGPI